MLTPPVLPALWIDSGLPDELLTQLGAALAFLSLFSRSRAFDTYCLSWEIGSICWSCLSAQHHQHTLPSLQCNLPGVSAPGQAAVTCGWAPSGAG